MMKCFLILIFTGIINIPAMHIIIVIRKDKIYMGQKQIWRVKYAERRDWVPEELYEGIV